MLLALMGTIKLNKMEKMFVKDVILNVNYAKMEVQLIVLDVNLDIFL